jgi:hypothetical protein
VLAAWLLLGLGLLAVAGWRDRRSRAAASQPAPAEPALTA